MSTSKQKIVQYLREARASETALVRVLQSQIAMTPQGSYRSVLEQHLFDTRSHAQQLTTRIRELEGGFHPLRLAVGVVETVTGQTLALAKTPIDLVRGDGGDEKVLKNAKDAAATEALEIATYTAIERLATLAGDTATAELAVSIRKDEEQMLRRVLDLIPDLTDAVHAADVQGAPPFDASRTGAAQAARGARDAVADRTGDVRDAAREKAEDAAAAAKDKAGDAASAAKGRAGDAASAAKGRAEDAAAAAKDKADDAAAEVQEKAADARETAGGEEDGEDAAPSRRIEGAGGPGDAQDEVERAADALADEAGDISPPWPDYPDSSPEQIRAVLLTADADLAGHVVAYERANEDRGDVVAAAERLAHAG